MTQEILNKMNKTQSVSDYKVFAVIDGKGKYIRIEDVQVTVGEMNSMPLEQILRTLVSDIVKENERNQRQYQKQREINKKLLGEIKKIKKELGLE